MTIDLTAEIGNSWANALAVLTRSSNGWEAVDNMSGVSNAGQALGFATPLPTALPMFVSGLGFIGYLVKRRKRNAKQALAAA